MNNKRFLRSAYVIFLMSYTTLACTLPLLFYIHQDTGISLNDIQFSSSFLYFFFSFSAIALGPMSDFINGRNILKYAQITSMTGLLVCTFLHDFISITTGFILIGIGTGCYSVIARSTICYRFKHKKTLFKVFTWLSVFCLLGPLLATIIVNISINAERWYWTYGFLFILELCVFIYSIKHFHTVPNFKTKKIRMKLLFKNILYCFNKWNFMKNVLLIGIFFSIVPGIFLGYGPLLFVEEKRLTFETYTWLSVGFCSVYILGSLSNKSIFLKTDKIKLRKIFISLFSLSVIFFFFSMQSITLLIISMFLISYFSGSLLPILTLSAMSSIKTGFGIASAFNPMSFALFCGIWSFVHAIFSTINLTTLIFILLFISTVFAIFLELIPSTQS